MKRYPFLWLMVGALILLLLMGHPATPALAQAPPPTPTTPTPTPGASLVETYESEIVKTLLSVLGKALEYIVVGVIGIVAYLIGKPRYDHWLERRKLRLKQQAEAKDKQQAEDRRRHVDDARLQVYLDRIAEAYNHTRLVGHARTIPLSDIFTEVYILTLPQAERRYDIQRLLTEAADAHDPRAVFAKLDQSNERYSGTYFLGKPEAHRLFILGAPGAGKTTFLRHLTCQAATNQLGKIPIFITLREWADSKHSDDLLAYIVDEFALYGFPDARAYVERLLEETDDVLVLFDGLDEIPHEGERHAASITALRDFARRYARAQVLITCRVAASDYRLEGFMYVEMADFNDDQITTYATKWFGEGNQKAKEFLNELKQESHQNLREMARTPLLLGLLCLNFDETLSFPARRVSLYTEALDALLKKWDSERDIQRDYQVLDVQRKHQLFAHLAYPAFVAGRYLFSQEQLTQAIAAYMQRLPQADRATPGAAPDGETVLRAIESQHGVLVERAHRIHAFAHLTFQEYYTARYVVENASEGTLPALLAHAREDRWREVLVLTASMLPNADGFFAEFVRMLDELIRGKPALTGFFEWAARKATVSKAHYKAAAIRGFYVYLARALDLARFFARAFAPTHNFAPDLDLALALDHASDLARALYRTLVRARAGIPDRGLAVVHAHAVTLDRDLSLALGHDLIFDRDLARPFHHDLTLDRDLIRALHRARDLDRALDLAQALGLRNLHRALETLSVPAEDASEEAWQIFAEQLQAIMIEHRDIGHNWDFDKQQLETLDRYIRAAEVLVKCLDVAIVTDRDVIEERLFMPPE